MIGDGVTEAVKHLRDARESARERRRERSLLSNRPELTLRAPPDPCADLSPPFAPSVVIQAPVLVEFDELLQLIQRRAARRCPHSNARTQFAPDTGRLAAVEARDRSLDGG